MTLYGIVVLLPIADNESAGETNDLVGVLVAVVESSRCHCRWERLYVKWPGVEGIEPVVPSDHVSGILPAAIRSCPWM